MGFHPSITDEEIAAVRERMQEGKLDERGRPLWSETAEEWYDRAVANYGDEAIVLFKRKAAKQAGAVTC